MLALFYQFSMENKCNDDKNIAITLKEDEKFILDLILSEKNDCSMMVSNI
jgi:hypothetical protein